jgi:ankyrin repeat protein
LLTAGADKEAKNQKGFTALISAAQNGHVECVDKLLTAGANKKAKTHQGNTALIIAAEEGHDKCGKLLLTAGADKEAKQIEGFTALISAAQNGHDKCVELLLNARCKVNKVNGEGASALLIGVQNEHIDCVRTLVRCGADILIQFKGASLDDIADRTTIADELKAALRLPEEKRRRCAHCSTTTSAKLQKCSVCRMVYYCNRECQVAHWQQHKLVCNVTE